MSIPERDAYTIDEARERLGGIARQTIYNLINSGELSSLSIASRRLIPATAIADFIKRHTERRTDPKADDSARS